MLAHLVPTDFGAGAAQRHHGCGAVRDLDERLRRGLEAGWLLLAITVPIAINPLAREPFERPKAALLLLLTSVMLVVWSAQGVAGARQRAVQIDLAALQALGSLGARGRAGIAAVAFGLAFLIGAWASIDLRISFWHSWRQALGTLPVLSYLAVFLISAAGLRSASQRSRLIMAIVLVSAPVAAYGILQVMGVDVFDWQSDSASRALSTLGRSNFLGCYLAMIVPLTLATVAVAHGARRRGAAVALLALQTACLVLSGARAAWLGLGAGLLVQGLCWTRATPGAPRRRLLSVIVVCAVILAAVALALPAPEVLRSQSMVLRLRVWRHTLAMMGERWLTGYGPGTFAQVFREFGPEIWRQPGRELVFSSAHNLALDLLAASGVLGLLSYVWLSVRLYITGFRAVQGRPGASSAVLMGGCLASLVAFQVQGMFTPSVISTQLLFWLVAALLVSLVRRHETERPGHQRWLTGCR